MAFTPKERIMELAEELMVASFKARGEREGEKMGIHSSCAD